MSKIKINITPDNITEWMCSTGYLFPRNEVELARFERLYPEIERENKDTSVDPFAILKGTRQRNSIKLNTKDDQVEDYPQIRMAARKYQDLPEHIIDKIKQNQKKSSDNDKPED
jgi:hypothetical protein